MTRPLLALVLLASVLSGCGSGPEAASPHRDMPVPLSRVHEVFDPSEGSKLDGVTALRTLMEPTRYGDPEEYSVVRGTPAEWEKGFGDDLGSITVFRTVRAARRASIRMRDTGDCLAHVDPRFFSVAKCKHLRVGNVLLIVGLPYSNVPGATAREWHVLASAMKKLGTPTDS